LQLFVTEIGSNHWFSSTLAYVFGENWIKYDDNIGFQEKPPFFGENC
jgi:hypothetical protein